MKKLLLSISMLAIAGIAFAQPTSGSLYLGGGFNISSSSDKSTTGTVTTDGESRFNFGISPMVGYFLTDNISAGLMLNYMSESSSQTFGNGDTRDISRTSFGLTPFARYHSFVNDKFGFFGQLALGFSSGKTKVSDFDKGNNTTTTVESPNSTFGINLSPGLQYFVSDHVSLEATFGRLGYNSETDGTTDKGGTKMTTTTPFTLNVNTSAFTFGFNYFF